MKKIRVLHVFGSLNVGGAETRTVQLFRNIDKERFSFDFLTMSLDDQYYEKEIYDLGGKIFKIAPPRSKLFGNLKDIITVLKENGPYDVVHAHTSFHCGLVMLAAKIAGVPTRISHARTSGTKHGGFKSDILLKIGRTLIKLFSTNRIAISRAAAIYLYGEKALKKVQIIPNAIDTSSFLCEHSSFEELYSEFSLPKDALIIGHIGRFEAMKNQVFVLDILKEMLNRNNNTYAVFVGEGSLMENAKNYAKQLNIDAHTRFVGVRSDIPNCMKLFDIIVMPSLFEGLCGVAIEAQAAGLPCVLSDRIPSETNLGLNLCSYVSLDATITEWCDVISKSLAIERPDVSAIKDAFARTGYSIDFGTKTFSEIYSSRKENKN